jgi:hypothetical protein
MDLKKFDELSDAPRPARNLIWQDWAEWRMFLEFAAGYFAARGIERPLVVEIGVMHNEQREFYRELLGAEHIGIDINVNNAPDICGDSSLPETADRLKALLSGREIDLLFIDGNHTDAGVRADYALYGPLTRHLVIFHDVHGVTNRVGGVNGAWNDIAESGEFATAVFHRYATTVSIEANRYLNMGIGVLVKG